MEIRNILSNVYLKKGSGEIIEEKIKEGKEKIIVVTPWISKKYGNLLKEKASHIGKENVQLITYEEESNYSALESIVEKRFNKKDFFINISFSIISLLFALYSLFMSYEQKSFILLVVFFSLVLSSLLFYVNARESFRVLSFFPIKIQSNKDKNFIHMKLYVIDDYVFISSANLSSNGINNNIESVVEIKDKNAKKEIISFIDSIEKDMKELTLEDFMRKYSIRRRFLSFK